MGNLIDIKEWQKVQDNFSAIADVGLRTLDQDGNSVTKPSAEPKICHLHIQSALKDELCGCCLPTFLGGRQVVDRNLSYICHLGLHTFIAPLMLEPTKIVGYVAMGPLILVARKPKEEYRKSAELLGIDLDEFWNILLEIRVISFQRAQGIIELIKSFGEYIIRLASRKTSFEDEIQEIISATSEHINALLKVFLDVALQVSGADIGSIMLLKKDTDFMTIRASKGIPEEVVDNTSVKLGDGISGIAAKENKSFLLDDNTSDNRIKKYLTRPYIRSSMVLPITIENNTLGVMNLGALETSPVTFNSTNLQAMSRLIDLAAYALRAPKR